MWWDCHKPHFLLGMPVTRKKVVVVFVCLAITLLKDEEFTTHLEYGEKQLLFTAVGPILTLPGSLSSC